MSSHAMVMWRNGTIIPWEQGTVHVMSPSLHYGVAAFEGIRFYETTRGPAVFHLQEHLDRFWDTMTVLGMKISFSQKNLVAGICSLIRQSGMTEGYIRPIAYYAEEQIGLRNAGGRVTVDIALFTWQKESKKYLRMNMSPYMRIHPETTAVDAKISGHYVNTHLALLHALACGYDDALLLDHEGNVAEASAANVFFVANGILITPRLGSILNGITRKTVIALARHAVYQVEDRVVDPEEISECEEMFVCGTAYEIMPVVQVDDQEIGNGELGLFTNWIAKTYAEVVRGKNPRYHHWLTFVS